MNVDKLPSIVNTIAIASILGGFTCAAVVLVLWVCDGIKRIGKERTDD